MNITSLCANDPITLRKMARSNIIIRILTAIMLLLGFSLLLINLYSINKGFSLWDESYYLMSYKMAARGFYPHFHNTPFVVAYLFERFNPGLIGYRMIHLALSVTSATIFTYSIIRFYKFAGYEITNLSKLLLLSIALYGAMYVYFLALATLSYNHLNEFFILISESFVLLALTSRSAASRFSYLLVSGAFLSLNLYIKPPSLISALICETLLLMLLSRDKKDGLICILILLCGSILTFTMSLIFFYPLSQWEQYLSFINSQQTHTPFKVIATFLTTAFDMFKATSSLIVSGILVSAAMIFLVGRRTYNKKITHVRNTLVCFLVALNAYYSYRFFFPPDIWTSFQVHWWYWWMYSSTSLLFVSVVNFTLGLMICLLDGWRRSKPIIFLLILLAVNPIVLSVGTLNGFGQVQVNSISWLLMSGIVLILCTRTPFIRASAYSSLLMLIFILVSIACFVRHEMPSNILGQGAIYEQKYSLRDFPVLRNVYADKATYDLLVETKAILDKYPNYPTLAFFDMPGLQYAFGREWVVPDPWLTNYEHPLTKDDDYNCRAIAGEPSRLKNTLLIVSQEEDIDLKLGECLSKIGYPKDLILIGTVNNSLRNDAKPIKIYLHH